MRAKNESDWLGRLPQHSGDLGTDWLGTVA
jgi:hypothetical protein